MRCLFFSEHPTGVVCCSSCGVVLVQAQPLLHSAAQQSPGGDNLNYSAVIPSSTPVQAAVIVAFDVICSLTEFDVNIS